MDSLLANYASSDEEEHQQITPLPPKPKSIRLKSDDAGDENASKRGGIFNSLPPPKSSIFNSLPPPKSQSVSIPESGESNDEELKPSSSLFSSLPPPKPPSSSLFSSLPRPKPSSKTKKVVQFRPPTIVSSNSVPGDAIDSDEEDEEERNRKRSKNSISTSSTLSFLSSIPAPKNSSTLGVLPSSGSGRKSVLETDTSSQTEAKPTDLNTNKDYSQATNYDYSNYDPATAGMDSNLGNSENYAYYGGEGVNTDLGTYEGVGSYGNEPSYDGSYGDYENNWGNVSTVPEGSGVAESVLQLPVKKKGRRDVPVEIIEVKQDELMKNRPREDQVKSTGIAFGPAYQPASTKGKPTKLHKRKHQIGSLYFDMRQKESELVERRSKGFLTKAQTQAKYGW